MGIGLLHKIGKITATTNRKFINKRNQKNLINKDFTLISSNCNGAFILHDLNLEFRTPTVNLFFTAEDFIKFTTNLSFYLSKDLEFLESNTKSYPIGLLSDIKIHFMHYKDNKEAKEQWNRRKKRVNYNNLFIMMTDRDNCTKEVLRNFEKIPHKNKVLFTNKQYDEYPSTFYIKGFEEKTSVGDIFRYKNIFGKKYYDEFDYVKWFNNGNK